MRGSLLLFHCRMRSVFCSAFFVVVRFNLNATANAFTRAAERKAWAPAAVVGSTNPTLASATMAAAITCFIGVACDFSCKSTHGNHGLTMQYKWLIHGCHALSKVFRKIKRCNPACRNTFAIPLLKQKLNIRNSKPIRTQTVSKQPTVLRCKPISSLTLSTP